MNYIRRRQQVIRDAVTAIGLYIAFYYGLTGFSCVWYYRKTLTSSARNLWMRGILPAARRPDHVRGGRLRPVGGLGVATGNSYTSFTVPFYPHWQVGGAFVICFLAAAWPACWPASTCG